MSQRTRARTTGAAASPINHSGQAPDDNATATATGTPRRARRVAAAPEPTAPAQPSQPAPSTAHAPALPLHPDALARALRAVATELERDPALAERVAQAINAPSSAASPEPARPPIIERRLPAEVEDAEPPTATIGRKFRPTIVTGIGEELGPGVPDPFALRERLGEDGLREALASLRLGSLRAIVREHKLDPSGALSKLNDAEKLREKILAATRKGRK